MSATPANRYWVDVDPTADNNAHAIALDLLGYNKRVLELGPAAGHVTRVLAERGCEVVGIEIDPDAAAGLEGFVAECLIGDLNDPSYIVKASEERGFDVILAGDVLEHLTDPLTTLRACRDALLPGGYLVISLPNVAHADIALSLHLGRFNYGDWGLLDRTHLRFFTLESIEELLEHAGMIAIDIRRVVVPVFETELALDPSEFTPEIVESVLAHPEAETFQFIVRAVPHNGDFLVSQLAQRAIESSERARQERMRRLTAEAEVDHLRHAVVTEFDQLHHACAGEIDHLRHTLAAAEHQAEQNYREAFDNARHIEAIFATKTMRFSAPFRAIYRALRQN